MYFLEQLLFFLILSNEIQGSILLYNTENTPSTLEYYDCIYYQNGSVIKYCRRSGYQDFLDRTNHLPIVQCYNNGQYYTFEQLLELDIKPSEIIEWSSSIEQVDNYAAYVLNPDRQILSIENAFLCNCTLSPLTFGKYCEYTLPSYGTTFDEIIIEQFELKRNGIENSQQYGNILCYQSLFKCDYGMLCLDWRNICDGEQQCIDGIDEENCDKLEFNECDNDEYRCSNGMCIPDQYFLDGEYDCMDFSDEQDKFNSVDCIFNSRSFDCDEHLCRKNQWSCGDGQCIPIWDRFVFQNFIPKTYGCYNYRDYNFLCELKHLWTMPSGLCYPFWIEFDLNVNGDRDEYCQYLLKCALSGGKELQCPCGNSAAVNNNQLNCSVKMKELMCSERSLLYPMKNGVIKPYMKFYYDINHNWLINKDPDKIIFNGSIKCRGYQARGTMLEFDYNENFILYSQFDFHFCNSSNIEKINSRLSYDEHCWTRDENKFLYQFSDICQRTSRYCISDYRLHDGYDDCGGIQSEDEQNSSNNNCFNQQKYRFTCSNEQQPTCLLVEVLGNNIINCLNQYDEFLFGEDLSVVNIKYQLLRQYIEYSSMKNHSIFKDLMNSIRITAHLSTNHVLPYHYYCDTFWDMSSKYDENIFFCEKYWICRNDQYQCLTGQCIPIEWLCDGEWDCADASDEQRLFIIEELSKHNQQLENLENLKRKCFQRYQNQSAFSTICNLTQEYPCFRSNTTEIIEYRPCIHLNQIGNGISDCYGSLDERNLLNGCNSIQQMGYDFHCNDDDHHHQCIQEVFLCERHCTNQYDQSLCFYRRSSLCNGKSDVLCLTGECKRRGRCDGNIDCPNGEDEYWCNSKKSLYEIIYYRRIKQDEQRQKQIQFQLITYPFSLTTNLKENKHVRTFHSSNINSGKLAFYCNRGISIIHNDIVCFCPPGYYGSKCQFYSDRITIITHVNFTNILSNSNQINRNQVIKILVLFIFEIDTVLDYHEFHIRPSIENSVKHLFYFLYSRSPIFIEHKRNRYLNRTNIFKQQPYQVRFEAYELNSNATIQFIGLWQYPIYFDYLSSFRLAKILTFPNQTMNNPCSSNPCQSTNTICQSILNQNQTYLCLCKTGYYGQNCQNYDEQCRTYCSLNSICKPKYRGILSAGHQYPLCLCSADYFGPSCHLRQDHCDLSPCLNNGSCYTTYDPTGRRPYMCQCIEQFYGDQCQYEKISIQIQLNIVFTESLASVIQYYDIDNITNDFILRYQTVYRSIPTIFRYHHEQQIAPILSILKLYNISNQCHYHILYIQQNQSLINITSTVSIDNQCVDVRSLLVNLSSSTIFQYHQLCQQWRNKSLEYLKCFYDDDYFCICDSNFYRAECFVYNHYLDQCQLCLSGGRCLKGDIENKHDFLCLCPRCHSGDRCQFSNELFSFTLDSLIIKDTFTVQLIYVLMTCIMFIVGSFNNLCSFMTFKRPKPRIVGVGNYLFIVTICNQLSLVILMMKILFIFLSNNHIYIDIYFSCKIISYLLSIFTRTNYWLTSLINIERVSLIFWPTKTTFKKPIVALTLSISTFFIISVMHIYELLYYTVLDRTVCVIDYARLLVSIYNRVNVLLHYLIPFFIQIITITILIILTAKNRFRGQRTQTTFSETFKKQFQSQKESYITPIIIILSSLPQIILAFNLTCTPIADQQWQRYLLLTAYFFSYTPQILGFILYVLPSTVYKQEFQETIFGKSLAFQWLFKRSQKLDAPKIK